MNTQINRRARILIAGLDVYSVAELQDVLKRQDRDVFTVPFQSARQCLAMAERVGADVVFCPADNRIYLPLLEAIRERHTTLPVVVVSRHPEVPEWLDAIEQGATDYCAAPFEPGHVNWILTTALFQGEQYMYAAS